MVKRVSTVLLVAVLIISFGMITGCSKKENATTTPTNTTSTTQTTQTTTPAAPTFSVGMTVAAKWKDNYYYLAEIKAVNSDKFDVAYADGDKATVPSGDLKEIPAKLTLKTGDKVLAVWDKSRFYPGTVQEVKAGGAVIKWDDGSSPSEVAFGKIIKQ